MSSEPAMRKRGVLCLEFRCRMTTAVRGTRRSPASSQHCHCASVLALSRTQRPPDQDSTELNATQSPNTHTRFPADDLLLPAASSEMPNSIPRIRDRAGGAPEMVAFAVLTDFEELPCREATPARSLRPALTRRATGARPRCAGGPSWKHAPLCAEISARRAALTMRNAARGTAPGAASLLLCALRPSTPRHAPLSRP